jgi:predicted lipid carrier protein YhbT
VTGGVNKSRGVLESAHQFGLVRVELVHLTADSSDYVKIFTGELDGMQAFMQGKIKLAGDLNLAMKLTQMFKIR